MYYSHDFSRSGKLSDLATALMAQHRIPPTPMNFVLWYEFHSGERPTLSKELQDLVDRKVEFTPELNESIYDKHFGFNKEGAAIRNTGKKLESEMEVVLAELNQSEDHARGYCERVASLLERARDAQTHDTLSETVSGLVSETRDIIVQNKGLEKRLEDTATGIVELIDHLTTVQQASMRDPLTGILNRKYFDINLIEETELATDEEQDLCLIMTDIDYFKKFNDSFGHQVGDEVLKLTARVLEENITKRDIVARYGGEEFCIILPQVGLDEAVAVAEGIRRALANKELVSRESGQKFGTITLSLGVSQYVPPESRADFIERADKALYEAKREGRNRTVAASF